MVLTSFRTTHRSTFEVTLTPLTRPPKALALSSTRTSLVRSSTRLADERARPGRAFCAGTIRLSGEYPAQNALAGRGLSVLHGRFSRSLNALLAESSRTAVSLCSTPRRPTARPASARTSAIHLFPHRIAHSVRDLSRKNLDQKTARFVHGSLRSPFTFEARLTHGRAVRLPRFLRNLAFGAPRYARGATPRRPTARPASARTSAIHLFPHRVAHSVRDHSRKNLDQKTARFARGATPRRPTARPASARRCRCR